MGVVLEIDDKLKDLFEAFSDQNKIKYLTAIGDLELSKTKTRFVQQVDPDNNPWRSTVRKALDPSAKILRKTGNLFNSLARKVEGDSVFIGTNLNYATTHQNGAVIKPKTKNFLAFSIGGNFFRKKQVTIPQRRLVGVNDETAKSIEQAFQSTMRNILR